MMHFCRCQSVFVLLLMLTVGSQVAFSQGTTAEPKPLQQPIGLINFSSLEKSLNEIGQMFKVTGRSDMIEVIDAWIAGNDVRNFQGVDRTRPIGVMFFLSTDLPPRPLPVTYTPVSDEAKIVEAWRLAGMHVVDNGEGAYQLGPVKDNSIPIRFRDGYAYMCLTLGSTFLDDNEIPSPEKLAAKLSSRYDVAASINLRGIPPLMKQVFATFFSQQSAAQLQQRDHESDASYQARRAGGLNALQAIEQIIRDGEEIVVGLDSTEDGRKAVLEVSIDAAPNSEYAKFLASIAGAPSTFTPLVRDKHPLQMLLSWNADQREKTAMLGYLEAIRLELQGKVSEAGQASIDGLIQTLQATVNDGHIDAIVQFIPVKDKKFVLLLGWKVKGSETLNGQFRNVARVIQEAKPNAQIDLDIREYQGTNFHRVKFSSPSSGGKRIFGANPALYWGVGDNILWVGIGSDDMVTAFESAIDSLSAPRTTGRATAAPFQLIFRALPWLQITETGKEGEKMRERRELAQTAIKPEDDALRVEVRPSDTGVRVTFRFDESFVRLLGIFLADRYDRSQL